jgi:hypothetical protein
MDAKSGAAAAVEARAGMTGQAHGHGRADSDLKLASHDTHDSSAAEATPQPTTLDIPQPKKSHTRRHTADSASLQLSSARNSRAFPNHRYSTYSTLAPSVAPSLATITTISSDRAQAEIQQITAQVEKLENKKLATQRYVPSREKSDDWERLALGAKLERALGRRLGGQDAVMRKKIVREKVDLRMSIDMSQREKYDEKGYIRV